MMTDVREKAMKINAVIICAILVLCSASTATGSPLLKGGTTDSSKFEDALATDCPQPAIPSDLCESCHQTSCVVRFIIEDSGRFSVRMVRSCGSEEVDDMVISTLRRWKFKPAQLDGKAIKSTRKVRVEFVVE